MGVRNLFCDGEEELSREIYGERKIVSLAEMKIGEEKGGKYLAKEIRWHGEGGGRRRSVRKYLYIFEEETICTTLIVYCPWKIVRYI